MSSKAEYISRKVMDRYHDRFTRKLVRVNTRIMEMEQAWLRLTTRILALEHALEQIRSPPLERSSISDPEGPA